MFGYWLKLSHPSYIVEMLKCGEMFGVSVTMAGMFVVASTRALTSWSIQDVRLSSGVIGEVVVRGIRRRAVSCWL